MFKKTFQGARLAPPSAPFFCTFHQRMWICGYVTWKEEIGMAAPQHYDSQHFTPGFAMMALLVTYKNVCKSCVGVLNNVIVGDVLPSRSSAVGRN